MGLELYLGSVREVLSSDREHNSTEEYQAEQTKIDKIITAIKQEIKNQTGKTPRWKDPDSNTDEQIPDISICLGEYELLHQLREFALCLEKDPGYNSASPDGFGWKILRAINKSERSYIFNTPSSQGLRSQVEIIKVLTSEGKKVDIKNSSLTVKGLDNRLMEIYLGKNKANFPQLINHSDSNGFYLPCYFPESIWVKDIINKNSSNGLISVGSSIGLLEELLKINEIFNIDIKKVSVRKGLNIFIEEVSTDYRQGAIRRAWAILFYMCYNSKQYNIPLIFSGSASIFNS
ncbi:MAG: hypothetical protein AB1782_12885 [Cyanobacteriota bacterium]